MIVKEIPLLRVSCIGSREISEKTIDRLKQVGYEIAKRGWIVVSGNAVGSDYAYASGANYVDPSLVELYQPWPSYNSDQLVEGNIVFLNHKPEWAELARQHHDRYDTLSQGAKKMMDRNAGIILGGDVTLAVMNPSKSWGGGTGHGWNIAKALNRNRYLLTKIQYDEPTVEDVIAFLQFVHEQKIQEFEKKSGQNAQNV